MSFCQADYISTLGIRPPEACPDPGLNLSMATPKVALISKSHVPLYKETNDMLEIKEIQHGVADVVQDLGVKAKGDSSHFFGRIHFEHRAPQVLGAPSHNNYCAQNRHVSQLIIDGQMGHHTVPLIIQIYPM